MANTKCEELGSAGSQRLIIPMDLRSSWTRRARRLVGHVTNLIEVLIFGSVI